MNTGVINLIVCAHDARDAAHRLTAPVSGGRGQDPVRRRPRITASAPERQAAATARDPSPWILMIALAGEHSGFMVEDQRREEGKTDPRENPAP
jgi:hypothetical protein